MAVVRLVKGVSGKGVTVQITPSQFGFIELPEITDDISGSVIDSLALIQPLFVARVIGFDKHQKAILSARDSVVHYKSW
jgi:predicted RNA-binding protein with RPS1 domain